MDPVKLQLTLQMRYRFALCARRKSNQPVPAYERKY